MAEHFYCIGEAGKEWGDAERAQWLQNAQKCERGSRSYKTEVLDKLESLKDTYDIKQYGALSQDPEKYPLFYAMTKDWDKTKPTALITGGVHGYEKSGVQGALLFLKTEQVEKKYTKWNLVVCPCVSPWGYETIQRWNSSAVDPNRSFMADQKSCPAEESGFMVALIAQLKAEGLVENWTCHIDLHETTDTDASEFRPAKASRDGVTPATSGIPDGYYLVGNSEDPVPEFHKAIIDAVKEVTHIAPEDENGQIIGTDKVQEGCVNYPVRTLFLCSSLTNAAYGTTTEVYPDSKTSPQTEEQCDKTQLVTVQAGLDYVTSKL